MPNKEYNFIEGKYLPILTHEHELWVQNIQSLTWDEDEINRMLEKIIIRAFNEVWDCSKQYEVTLRLGANIVALDRIVRAKKIRSVFP